MNTHFKSMKLWTIFIFGLFAISIFNACEGQFEATSGQADQSSLTDPVIDPPVVPPEPVEPQIELTAPADTVVSELAAVQKTSITVSAVGGNTEKAVDFRIDTPEIDALDVMDGINISFDPATATLQPGSSVTVEITINVSSLAPSFAVEHFHFEAYEAGTELLIDEAEVNLNVRAVFRIQVHGIGDDNWVVGGKTLPEIFPNIADQRPRFDFVHHPQGLQVVFENYDMERRRIHSGGTIDHQPGSMAASPDGVTVVGAYIPDPVIGDEPSNSRVYLHDDENGGASRELRFNVDL